MFCIYYIFRLIHKVPCRNCQMDSVILKGFGYQIQIFYFFFSPPHFLLFYYTPPPQRFSSRTLTTWEDSSASVLMMSSVRSDSAPNSSATSEQSYTHMIICMCVHAKATHRWQCKATIGCYKCKKNHKIKQSDQPSHLHSPNLYSFDLYSFNSKFH